MIPGCFFLLVSAWSARRAASLWLDDREVELIAARLRSAEFFYPTRRAARLRAA